METLVEVARAAEGGWRNGRGGTGGAVWWKQRRRRVVRRLDEERWLWEGR